MRQDGYSDLEKRVFKAEKLGQEWVGLYGLWLQLDSDEKNFLSAVMVEIKAGKDGKISMAELEMEARASDKFRDYVKNLCTAKQAELSAKVKYENARDFFEAGRSGEATERQKMQTLSHIP